MFDTFLSQGKHPLSRLNCCWWHHDTKREQPGRGTGTEWGDCLSHCTAINQCQATVAVLCAGPLSTALHAHELCTAEAHTARWRAAQGAAALCLLHLSRPTHRRYRRRNNPLDLYMPARGGAWQLLPYFLLLVRSLSRAQQFCWRPQAPAHRCVGPRKSRCTRQRKYVELGPVSTVRAVRVKRRGGARSEWAYRVVGWQRQSAQSSVTACNDALHNARCVRTKG